MKTLILCAFSAFAIGCATTASERAAAREEASEEEVAVAVASAEGTTAPKKERKICTRTRVTGTHLYKQVCRTEQQAAEERDAAQNAMMRRAFERD